MFRTHDVISKNWVQKSNAYLFILGFKKVIKKIKKQINFRIQSGTFWAISKIFLLKIIKF